MTTTIFKRRLVPLLLAACFGAAVAAPTGQQVVAGQATFSQQGNVFSITNTPGTIINWQGFSINQGEITRFIQQSADSAVLNRIVGQDPSKILGALQSNGKVFLINPNGILFGRDSRVDVNGLVASSLNLSNADFLAGKKNFQAGAVAGAVRNEGAITTRAGGQVFLVAPDVSNAGVITSPKGDVVLAAGHSVQLVDSRDPDLQVVVSAPADQAINLGQVVAHGGRIGIYGALVSQRGLVNANSAVVGENGKIVLKASRATELEAGSVTSAAGAGTGGEIHLLGETVALNGNAAVNASGNAGGGTVLVGGDWQGQNAQVANASRTFMGKNATIKADALASGDGGKVVLWSNQSTVAYGSISARAGAGGGNGGRVETSGHSLDVSGIKVNASAAKGKSGSWLLDPYDIEVVEVGAIATPADVASPNAGPGTGVAKIAPSVLTAAGADITLEAQHDITVTDAITTGGNVLASAGHDLNINANVTSSSGNLTLHAANGINLASGASLKGGNYIDLIADQMTLAGTIGAAGGQKPIVTFNPGTDSRTIQIGSGTPANGVLWLDAGALSRVSAFGINVGSSANTGGIVVDGAINQAGNVILDSAGAIHINAPITATGADTNVLATLHGEPGTMIDVGAAVTAGKLVQLKGDGLRISAPVTAPSVVLAPHDYQTPISLGTLNEGAFSLDEAMLKKVNASSLTIGGQAGQVGDTTIAGAIDLTSHPFGKLTIDAGAPGLTIDAPFTMSSGALVLKGGNLYESNIGALNVDQLSFTSSDEFRLNGSNSFGTIAGTAANRVIIDASGPLRVGQVAGVSGITSSNSEVRVDTDGALTLGADVSSGHDQVVLAGAGISGSGTVRGSAIQLQSTNGIGSATAPINTVTGSLQVYNTQSGSKPVNVSNAGDLSLWAMLQTDSSAGQNSGSVTLHNTGNLTVEHPPAVSSTTTHASASSWGGVHTGSGSVDLSASGVVAINGSVTTDSGNISLIAGGDMTVAGVVASTSGNLNLAAGSGARLTVLQGASVESNSGEINVTAGSTTIASGTITAGSPDKIHVTGGQPAPPPPAPTLAQCVTTPTLAGCVPILLAARTACSADWNAGSCDQVMPAEAVAAHKALLACVANPDGPNCGTVLPSVETCQGKGSQLGCDVVLAQRARLDACVAHPTNAGCEAVLPTWDQCQAKPGLYACGPAITQHDKVTACVTSPFATCFDTTLPSWSVCSAKPDTYGCAPVQARQSSILACIANPTSANCGSLQLPALPTCQADASVYGCSATLARQKFSSCSADATGAGCDSILPALPVCKLTPGAEGCGAVISKTFSFCLGSPNDARCVGILPVLSECVADKSKPGCQAVLPTMPQCIASPTLQGCQVVLPKLEQCAANPNLQGCEAVLPKPDFCATHPQDASCAVFNPAPSGGTGDEKASGSGSSVAQSVQTTVTLINTATGKTPASSGGGTSSGSGSALGNPAGTSTNSSSSSSSSGSDSSSEKPSDKQSGPAASENSGAKNEKPATKTYCN
jgi:filamentous hemagglutinin family protein